MARTLRPLKAYPFRGQDPVCDKLREVWNAAGRPKFSQISKDGGAATSTISNQIKRKTRRPQYCTIMASMKAMGYDCQWFKSRVSPVLRAVPAQTAEPKAG